MNILIIVLSALVYVYPSQMDHNTLNNPLNHIVSYESYATNSPSPEMESEDCSNNLFLFSNHNHKKIQVRYTLSGEESSEVQTVTLQPLQEKQTDGGSSQSITRPEKIGATCDVNFEIIDATYVDN